jgi:hypothetical protein
MTRPKEVSMHPKMMIALAHEVESARQRERKQIERRSLALQLRRMGGRNYGSRIAGHQALRRLLVVPRLLARLS